MDSEEWGRLEKIVGGINAAERSWLEAEGYVEDYDQVDRLGLDFLASKLREMRQPESAETKEKADAHVADRAWVVSLLVAGEASQDDAVADFRKNELRGRLVKPSRMADWITRKAGEPDDARATRQFLVWAAPDDAMTTRTPVASGSPADKLRLLADNLATFYGWQAAQGPAFVLCDAVPICSPLRVRHIDRGPIRAASRIVLEIDPTVPSADVERAYSKARKVWRERYKPVSERDLNAVAFATERPELGGVALLADWNAAHPEWAFANAEALARVVRAASRKLLDPFG